MDQHSLENALAGLPLGWVKYFERTGSTNDEALRWIEQGAPDLSLIVANEQTAGRGRAGRTWRTVPEAALALSLVLSPDLEKSEALAHLTALGALSACEALRERYGLKAQIKWPNDVLVDRQKIGGVLVETLWTGNQHRGSVLGIGLNVKAESVGEAALPHGQLQFPATSLELALGHPVSRLDLLRALLEKIIAWRKVLGSNAFLEKWEDHLAFRGEWVWLSPGESTGEEGLPERGEPGLGTPEGQVLGLAPDGSLKLRMRSGEVNAVRVGEVRLRPPG